MMDHDSAAHHIVFCGPVREQEAEAVFAVSSPDVHVIYELFGSLRQQYERAETDHDAEQLVVLMDGEEQLDHFFLTPGAVLFIRSLLSIRSDEQPPEV